MNVFQNSPEALAEYEDYARDLRQARQEAQLRRDAQAAALYPHARTFVLEQADAVGVGEAADRALAQLPDTLTLVTPDLDDPSRDHLFVGPYPVPARDMEWDPAFEELRFSTTDGHRSLTGTLRLTHSRLFAFGTVTLGGQTLAVEYRVDPQRYRLKLAKDAAVLSGERAVITWDTDSARWKNADWSDYELGFTYGVDRMRSVGDDRMYEFVARFDDIPTQYKWQPDPGTYTGLMHEGRLLEYSLLPGVRPPADPEAKRFPFSLVVQLSEFAFDMVGGIVVGNPGYKGTCYGVKGEWTGNGVAGLYHLGHGGRAVLVGVHHRRLYAGTTPAAHTEFDGDVLTWSGLPEAAAAAAGIPTAGSLTFSADGHTVPASSFGASGARVSPDEAVALAHRAADAGFAEILGHAAARTHAAADDHTLEALLRMSQFAKDADNKYYDKFQGPAMEDFYKILQNHMDSGLRDTFFGPKPTLEQYQVEISKVKGTKGTEPFPWFESLSVPYTASAVGSFSQDPWAKTLNIVRAEQWMEIHTSASDVMDAQSPLLYRHHYGKAHKNLDWFLLDQRTNHVKYALEIDAQVEAWLKTAREANVGTPEEMEEIEKRFRNLGKFAKDKKQYWAFKVYTSTTMPSYLNMLRLVLTSGVSYDGSEFSQRVQRTVALLNVLDTSSFFSGEYAYLLQLFELGVLLPEIADLGTDIKDFNYPMKLVIAKFIETYLKHPDEKMRDAAEQLQKHASEEFIGRMLSILRTAAGVSYGLNNWGYLVAQFETKAAKIFGGLIPSIVLKAGAICAMSLLLSMFLGGSVDFHSLPKQQQDFIILAATNTCAMVVIVLLKQGLALSRVWDSSVGVFRNLGRFFNPTLVMEAQSRSLSGLRGYLLSEAGPKVPTDRLSPRQWWLARQQLAEESSKLAKSAKGSKTFLQRLFGKNLSRFMARALAGAFAILGIVMSAIDLAHSTEPLERAANIMFIIASCLELVAVIGGWALAGSALAVGGMLVSTIFSIVSGIGFVALVVGVILLIVLMTRPQPTPVEKFARDRAGDLYMQYKAAIESFRLYKPLGEVQRAGIAMFIGTDAAKCVRIGSDGAVTQGTMDNTGHTAFYISVDDRGRTRIGAPIVDREDVPVLQSIAVDADGKVTSVNYLGENAPPEPKALWYADILAEGTYEDTAGGNKELKSAPFRLRSVYWTDDQKSTRYLAQDGAGWKLTTDAAQAATIRLEMVSVKPAELAMSDISWFTVAHNELANPALQVPGSHPRKWAVSPALPEGLELDAEEGIIRMLDDYDVPAAPKTTYTLSVSNALGKAETTFALEVVVPDDEFLNV